MRRVLIMAFIFFIVLSGKVLAANALEDGTYEIVMSINENKALDISTASINQGANVQIWDKCNGEQQRFKISKLSDGTYIITNINSGKVLDVKGASSNPKTNVQQWEKNFTDAQKWIIESQDTGYSVKSKCNGLYLNVKNNQIENGTNVEVDLKKQTFKFKKVKILVGSKTIDNGYYFIVSAIDQNKVLDISQASKLSGANVQIWGNESVPQQKFYVQYDGQGYYTVKNVNSGKVLDVAGGKTERWTNVQQWTSNSTDAQKWIIEKRSDGLYNIISKRSGIFMEVENGINRNGTNVRINYGSNSENQKFLFVETKIGTKTISDGKYQIVTKLASNMILDVSGGVTSENANIQIWADANVNQQKFDITYVGNGNYKIICNKSGKALTVSKNGTAYSSNVIQNTYTGSANQLWRIEKKNENLYYIISEYNGRYLDVAGASISNGTNIRVYQANYSNSQSFLFEQRKYGIDVSVWQGTIDFGALSKSKRVNFMIARAGHGLNIIDKQFERNYTQAKKYGIPIGVYLYANAQNLEEARAEANHLLTLIKGKKFELPIYYDVEAHEGVDSTTITNMCIEFCNIIRNAGYKPGIYASKYYLIYKMYPSKLPKDCSIWVASYGQDNGNMPKDAYRYNGRYDYWQFTSKGSMDGITGDVDFNWGRSFLIGDGPFCLTFFII